MKAKNKFTFVDLFAGCGGLSEGFLQSEKFEALAHIEWEKSPVKVLRNRLIQKWNHTEDEALKRVIHFDVQKTDELLNGNWSSESCKNYAENNHLNVIESGINGIIDTSVDLVIGGPPCQAYSIAGRAQDKNSMKDDYRNYLFESFVKIVDNLNPKMFVFENVPGMLSAAPGGIPVTERIFDAFADIGYEILEPLKLKDAVLNSSQFGVPQSRRRLIIVGLNKNWEEKPKLQDVYKVLKKFKTDKVLTTKDAIGHYEKLFPLEEACKIAGKNYSHQVVDTKLSHHNPRYNNDRDVNTFQKWIEHDMNSRPMVEKIAFYNDLHNKQSKHAKYRSLEWHKPSPTVVAHLYKDGLMFIHPDPDQARSITVREAATLQSFPEDFEFLDSQGVSFKMIGNAVPVTMAKHIAEITSSFLEKI